MGKAHLEFLTCKPMDESNVASYILPGYLAPRAGMFATLIRALEGEVVFVEYSAEWNSNAFINQLGRRLMQYAENVEIRLYGFSLGANIAYHVAGIFNDRRVKVWGLFPLIAADCLKPRVRRQVEILVKIGGWLARKRGDEFLEKVMFVAYGKPRTVREVLTGAEAIVTATQQWSAESVVQKLVLAEDDQYLDCWQIVACARDTRATVRGIKVLKMKHCWNVWLFERKRFNLGRVEMAELVAAIGR